MRIVCAWCDADMGTKAPYDDTRTTHDICPRCYRGMIAEIEATPERGNENNAEMGRAGASGPAQQTPRS
jgi:hypothetical protein